MYRPHAQMILELFETYCRNDRTSGKKPIIATQQIPLGFWTNLLFQFQGIHYLKGNCYFVVEIYLQLILLQRDNKVILRPKITNYVKTSTPSLTYQTSCVLLHIMQLLLIFI